MITSELVDELVALHNGWNRDGDHGVLRYLNMANSLLVSVDAEQNIVYDDGELPSIDTTTGIRIYELPTTIRRVSSVVVKVDDLQYNNDYGKQPRTSFPNSIIVGGVQYSRIPYVRSFDKVGVTPARVQFALDPGTTTDYFRRISYKTPTNILSESIQHDVAEPYDTMYLLTAATMIIDAVENNTMFEAMNYIKTNIVASYAKTLGDGDQGAWDTEPVDRGF